MARIEGRDSQEESRIHMFGKLKQLAATIGPGIAIIGYIIGTGSVTSMASAGAKFGLSLTWALALSCFFTYLMTVAISRITIVTGHTLIHNIRRKFGLAAALFIIVGLMLTVTTSVMGVMGIASDVIREWTRPLTASGDGISPIVCASLLSGLLYALFFRGTHGFFLKAMAVMVAVMGACFLLTMFMVMPSPGEIAKGLVPKIPSTGSPHLILAGMVGTTMAGVCLVTRSYLVAEKGWTLNDLRVENRDSAIALSLTFLLSAAIMASAAATMHVEGIEVKRAIDMVRTLEPLAGRFAMSLFAFGIIAAALSSVFPNYLLGPWLYFDLTNTPRDMKRTGVRLGVFFVALMGLVVPIFSARPVALMIASQALSPVVMPVLIVFVYLLANDKQHASSYRQPTWLNLGLIVTFMFSIVMAYAAIVGLRDFLASA